MNLCDDIRAQLPLYLGGDLEAPLAERVRDHLEGNPLEGQGGPCAGCARALFELREVRARLLELPERSPAPVVDLWPRVRQGLLAEGLLSGTGPAARTPLVVRRPAGRLLSWPRLASAAAAVALVALGLQLGGQDGPVGPGGEPQPTRAPALADRQGPAAGGALAEQVPVLPVAAGGGLRRLGEDERPLYTEARPFLDWMHGWAGPRVLPGVQGAPLDPSRPTFASDRSLR